MDNQDDSTDVRKPMSLPDTLDPAEHPTVLIIALHAFADILQICLEALVIDDTNVDDDTNSNAIDFDMLARFSRITHLVRSVAVHYLTRPILGPIVRRVFRQTIHQPPTDQDIIATYDQYSPSRVLMAQIVSELQALDLKDARKRDLPNDYLSVMASSTRQSSIGNRQPSIASSDGPIDTSGLRRRLKNTAIRDMDDTSKSEEDNSDDGDDLDSATQIKTALSAATSFDIQSLISARQDDVKDDLQPSTWEFTMPRPKRQLPMTESEFTSLRSGSLEAFRNRIFSGGCIPQIRLRAWKYLLYYLPWHYSQDECDFAEQVKTEKYSELKADWIARLTQMDEETLSESAATTKVASLDPDVQTVRESYHRIEKDVLRTDRSMSFFAAVGIRKLEHPTTDSYKPNNLEKLRDVLMTYACCGSEGLGYVQGMSDLCSPLLNTMDGDEAATYWCMVEFMKQMKDNFRKDGAGMRSQLESMEKLILVADKPLHDHLDKTGSTNMFFIFRFILVYFKREFDFEETLLLWECIWANPYCRDFHLLVAFAIIEAHRDVIMRYLRSPDEVLKYMNSLSGRIDVHAALEQAHLAAILLQERARAHGELPAGEFRLGPVLDALISSESLI
ncbi:hypothetical protein SmJEL517_g05489 [Synchytrium microbalum]|uniref:Rab-GAP TBC domain-containing protein n=1 Tax=Synchytrium microbalum TaxID=1806994 RepID=A0A507C0P4_9FUNG|nr:uncharacterized protein SmJEL517_g05489 [Synchytrium microbalum]TPX31103.1 hypothetical protein SmJEL517_g05489 [Synchytrium microbalum]